MVYPRSKNLPSFSIVNRRGGSARASFDERCAVHYQRRRKKITKQKSRGLFSKRSFYRKMKLPLEGREEDHLLCPYNDGFRKKEFGKRSGPLQVSCTSRGPRWLSKSSPQTKKPREATQRRQRSSTRATLTVKGSIGRGPYARGRSLASHMRQSGQTHTKSQRRHTHAPKRHLPLHSELYLLEA